MAQRPFQTGAVVNLSNGESTKEAVIIAVPKKKRFHTQFLGINGFGQPKQSLFYAVHVTTRSRVGIYPIPHPAFLRSMSQNSPRGISEVRKQFFTRILGPISSSRSRARSLRAMYGCSSTSADCSWTCDREKPADRWMKIPNMKDR